MWSLLRPLTHLLLMIAAAVPLAAQSPGVLHVVNDTRFVEYDLATETLTAQAPLPGPPFPGTYTTGDGAFTAWRYAQGNEFQTPRTVAAWDVRGRRILDGLASTSIEFSPGVAGHPRRPELYVVDLAHRVAALTPTGLHVLDVQPGCRPDWLFAISDDGRRLAVNCGMDGVRVLDLVDRRVYGPFPGTGFPVVFSPGGGSLFMVEGPALTLRKYSIKSASLMAEAPVPLAGWMYYDPLQPRLVIVGDPGLTMPYGTLVLDAETLAIVATGPSLGTRMAFDQFRPRAYAVDEQGRLSTIDTRTLQVLSTRTLPPGRLVGLTLASVPSPPADLQYTVTRGEVTLTWSQPRRGGAPTTYLVAVGSAPGRSDLATLEAPTSILSATGVPAGTYYVRIRGVNAVGTSLPSDELVVTVP